MILTALRCAAGWLRAPLKETAMSVEASANGIFDIGFGAMAADPAIMETGKVSLDVYTSQERFDREKEMFGRIWLNISEAAEIPNAGDWIARDVKVRSASVILVRGKDMVI